MEKVVLPLQAVEEMLDDIYLMGVVDSVNPRDFMNKYKEQFETVPDWVIAGLNCQDENDIPAICMHTFLMDWRPK
jgi:hypothetical protein